jgi:hypothetical protein
MPGQLFLVTLTPGEPAALIALLVALRKLLATQTTGDPLQQPPDPASEPVDPRLADALKRQARRTG